MTHFKRLERECLQTSWINVQLSANCRTIKSHGNRLYNIWKSIVSCDKFISKCISIKRLDPQHTYVNAHVQLPTELKRQAQINTKRQCLQTIKCFSFSIASKFSFVSLSFFTELVRLCFRFPLFFIYFLFLVVNLFSIIFPNKLWRPITERFLSLSLCLYFV